MFLCGYDRFLDVFIAHIMLAIFKLYFNVPLFNLNYTSWIHSCTVYENNLAKHRWEKETKMHIQ